MMDNEFPEHILCSYITTISFHLFTHFFYPEFVHPYVMCGPLHVNYCP
jgi:hypothetical protein